MLSTQLFFSLFKIILEYLFKINSSSKINSLFFFSHIAPNCTNLFTTYAELKLEKLNYIATVSEENIIYARCKDFHFEHLVALRLRANYITSHVLCYFKSPSIS